MENEILIQDQEYDKYYVWLSGEYAGVHEKYMADDVQHRWFLSGRFLELEKCDFMLGESNKTAYENYQKTLSAPPNMSFNNLEALLGNDVQPQTPAIVYKERSPIDIILEKQKKHVECILPIDICYDIPIDKTIDILTTMFDEDEVLEGLYNSAIAKMNFDLIKQSIETTIKTALKAKIDSFIE